MAARILSAWNESLQPKALMLVRKEQLKQHLEDEKTEICKISNAVRIG